MTSHVSSGVNAIQVSSRWDALFEGPARASLESALPAYVASRRWYRTKTKRVQAARVTAAFPIGFGAETARLAMVELSLDDGARDTYVMPLAFVHGEEASALRTRRPQAIVLPLRVTAGSLDGYVVDALALEPFLGALLASLSRGASIADSGAVLQFHRLAPIDKGPLAAHLVDGGPTSSSVLFGERYVGKLVRKVEPGESPDVELRRLLTTAGYEHTPALVGWIDVRRGDEPPSTIGLLHAYVANEGDAWEHVLGVLGTWLDSASQRDSAPPRLPPGDLVARASDPLPADVVKAVGSYAELAYRLGRRVGEMHVALAGAAEPAFAPEPFARTSREAIVTAVRVDLQRALEGLGARGALLSDAARRSLADARGRVRSVDARLADVAQMRDAGVVTRVHGDLHLGQVLFTGSDFSIVDFEGEPARTLEERKRKRSPLVDVAGMLRSFHYASVASLRARPEGARAALAPWASLWHRAVSATFLRGWLAAVDGTIVAPRDPAATRWLLDLFLFEKAVYEVGYEMNNRPDWVDIPLDGLREILGDEATIDVARASAGSSAHLERGLTPIPTTKPSRAHPLTPSHPPTPSTPPREQPTAAAEVLPSMLDPRSPALAAFAYGKATHAHALLGAHPHQDGAIDFAVWAPHASRVSVIGDFNDWSADASALLPVGKSGIHAGRVRRARPGQRYKYRIEPSSGGEAFDKADPFAVMSEPAPGNASVVTTLTHAWGDEGWMERRVQTTRLDRPMSIYEVHLGSWRRDPERGDRLLGYREIAAPLAAHAKEMGFTHVELLPLLEHPFYGSWGDGVTGFFAATSRYGTPSDLMCLVDTLHKAGLGVILDWVPAHFANDPHGLTRFDGSPLFESADTARAVHPTWRSGVFDFSKPEVRSFLLSSAIFWIETFHADGLRVDGVESIVHLDHHGGQEDLDGVSFLRELTSTLKIEHPDVLLVAEDSSAWPGVTRAASGGGLGFDLKWDMGFSHDLRRYLGIDPIERSHHQGVLTFRSVYAANESFVLPLSHDDVIEERGGALLQQMHGDPWQKLANLRLLYAMAWAQPGKKLLFMGDELALPRAWHHDRGLDWHLGREMPHEGIARMIGHLNRVYREVPALHAGDASPNGFEWIDGSNAGMSVIVFARRGRGDDDVVLVALNFTPVPRHQYRIGVPRGGRWREIFNSDAREYGGSGHGNLGGVDAVPYPWNGRASSVVVTLPPLGAIFLARG
jgi:1,4-alpha-glucan branching enzyme